MSGTMSSNSHHGDHWLAQQYVLGELSPQAAGAFEARLADDAVLCQRVADATLLIGTLEVIGTLAATRPRVATCAVGSAKPGRRTAAFAAVAAVAFCLLVSVMPRPDEPAPPDHRASANGGVATKLLSLWRGQSEWRAQGDVLRSTIGNDSENDSFDDADWSSDQVPSWMIAAVALERRATASERVAPGHPAPVPAPGQNDDLEDN